MVRWLWDNLRTLMLALLLALLVWAVASNEENPIEERAYPQPVTIELQQAAPDLILMGNPTLKTTVTVRAPKLIWDSLTADQIHVHVDLSQVSSGTYTLPLVGVLDEPTARLLRLDPPTLTLTYEKRATRELPVRLEQTGDVAHGYEASPAVLAPLTTTLTGPASLVDSVSEVRAVISLADLKDDYNDTVPLRPLNSAGKLVSGLDLAPAATHASVAITQKQGFRDVTVSPIITGQVASGYRLTNLTVSPAVVTVSSSDPLKVTKLPGYIETQPLDISGWNADRTVRLPLALPAGISLEGEQQMVYVNVSIAAIEYSVTVPRQLEIQGLDDQLEAFPSLEKVDIILSGPLPMLNQLRPEDVRVFLNLKNLGEGTHQVIPLVTLLPTELRVEKVLTSPIEVVIRAKPTPTPTVTPTATETATATLTPTPTLTPTRTAVKKP